MDKSVKSTFESFGSILILLPKGPYFDQVAAGLALQMALKGSKNVALACPSPMVVEFNRLIGVDKISAEVGNKNLVVKFREYPAEHIERVSYDIDNQEFRLSVIPKPNMTPPTKDQIQVTYSGVAADATILIGGANESHFPALSSNELVDTKLVHIGTQDLNTGGKKNVISLSKPASSISEVVAELIKNLEIEITQDVATNLLAGIHEGSRNFTSGSISSATFKLVAELMDKGGRREHTRPEVNMKNFPPGVVPFNDIKQDSFNKEETPEGESVNPPKSWLQPKIYKGTGVS